MISQSSCKTRTTSEILQQRNRWECKHHVNVGSTRAAESSVPNRCQSTMHELGKLSLAFSTIFENRITQMYMANSVRKKNGKIKLKHEKWDKRYLIQITVWETTIKKSLRTVYQCPQWCDWERRKFQQSCSSLMTPTFKWPQVGALSMSLHLSMSSHSTFYTGRSRHFINTFCAYSQANGFLPLFYASKLNPNYWYMSSFVTQYQ